jgi:uncharacterized protein (DUF433 family)
MATRNWGCWDSLKAAWRLVKPRRAFRGQFLSAVDFEPPEGIMVMVRQMVGLNPRITVEPGKMGGKPCIRGLRFTVYDLASYLASGMTEDEILADFPYLEKEDFQAVYEFFASIPERIAVLEASR